MSCCNDLETYLARGLDPAGRTAFEGHLEVCDDCRRQVEDWRALAAALASGARESAAARPVTADERRALVERARTARYEAPAPSRRAGYRVAAWAAAAASVAVAAAAVWFASGPEPRGAEDPGVGPGRPAARAITAPAGEGATARVGPARLVLEPGARITIGRESTAGTEITLVQGRIALDVDPLKAGEAFMITAGGLEILVVGTVLSVSWDGRTAGIEVAEGTVKVSGKDGAAWSVTGGRKLGFTGEGAALVEELRVDEIARMLDLFDRKRPGPAGRDDEGVATVGSAGEPAITGSAAPAASAAFDDGGSGGLGELRGLVASGLFIEAEGRLEEYLKARPADTAAWSLLADCRRKSGRYSDAVAAYLELIDHATGSEADLARYKAGVILQDRLGDHVAAARLFGEVLGGSGGDALAPDAMVRAARSHAALGQTEQARTLLEQVLDRYAGHHAAGAARRLLEQMEGKAEGSGPPGQHSP